MKEEGILNYFIIPVEEITKDMLSHMSNATMDTLRRSVRPIDGRIYGVCKHYTTNEIPEYFQKYKPYPHKEILEVMNSKEWNIHSPISELMKIYSWNYVEENFNNKRYLEAFGHVYITLFSILKFKFLIHSYNYLNSENKWKIFKSNKFEGANEITMLQMCYFFDLISENEYKSIDKFRDIRNSINHTHDYLANNQLWDESLSEMNKFIQAELENMVNRII